MANDPSAEQPKDLQGKNYHTHTGAGDLAPLCLIVGAPGRATMIAGQFLANAKRFANEQRGLVSYTGDYTPAIPIPGASTRPVRVSVTTSGMGAASIGIVLPEAVRSGARIFLRVGSCGSLVAQSRVGDLMVVNAAIRYDGVSENWAPLAYPAVADWRVVEALHQAGQQLANGKLHSGVECTTGDFYGGQGRPNLFGNVPPHLEARHQEVLRLGVSCYSMEAASLFVWCATEGSGLPCGAVNAIFANRITGEWGTAGEELAAEVALGALCRLAAHPDLDGFLTGALPVYR